jgi:spermidine/putrescine transport system ATP-binding protein
LTKRYGSVVAVDDVSLQIRQGEFFSLLGPSGAGKTSLLRMLGGFEAPDAGVLTIEGRSMAGVPAHRRPVNLVFQSYALFPHLRVGENIAFGLEMKRLPRAEIRERIREMLEIVKLAGRQDRWPHQLSGGEQQRVALARALVNRPAVLLLDEPLSALDQQLRQEMQVELKSIQELVGITFVCVTHHQQEALAMSNRVGVMQEGRIAQVGSPRDIYERPISLPVARFIGESNELYGTVHPRDDGQALLTADGVAGAGISVRWPGAGGLPRTAVLMLRPEQLRLSREGSRLDGDNMVRGRLEKCLYVGRAMEYIVSVAEAVRWKVIAATTHAEEKLFSPGEQVYVRWRTEDGILFPE